MRGVVKKVMILILILTLGITGCEREQSSSLEEIKEEERTEQEDQPNGKQSEEQEDLAEAQEAEQAQDSVVCVYVCGYVANPGVYELDGRSRIYQAIEAAGGILEEGDSTYVNQAETLMDGQRVYIPSKEEVTSGKVTVQQDVNASGGTSDVGKVNLNTAGKEELMTLNGIGERKAEAILSYRQENGRFESVEELMQVEGIKEGTFQKIRDQIVI